MARRGSSRRTGSRPSTWSAAIPVVRDGRRFASKMEARVAARLKLELLPGEKLFYQVRLPLLGVTPTDAGIPLYLTVDFAIVNASGLWRLIEAKTKRVSRDWNRGKRACEATYGVTIEETDQ